MASTSQQANLTPSERVVTEVAAFEDTDPLALPPLFDAIDPEALDELASEGVGVSLEYSGYEVLVRGEEEVVVLAHDG